MKYSDYVKLEYTTLATFVDGFRTLQSELRSEDLGAYHWSIAERSVIHPLPQPSSGNKRDHTFHRDNILKYLLDIASI